MVAPQQLAGLLGGMGGPPPQGVPGMPSGAPPGMQMPPAPMSLWQDPPANPPAPRAVKKPKKPQPDYLLQRVDAASAFWNLRNTRMDTDEQYYRLQIGEDTGLGNIVIRNIPRVMVDKAAGMVGNAKVTYQVVTPRGVPQHLGQKKENFIRYMWEQFNRRRYLSGYASLYHNMAFYLSLRGWLAMRVQYDPDAGPEELPVRLFVEDPRQVFPMFGEGKVTYVAYSYDQTVSQVIDMWPDLQKTYGERAPEEIVKVKQYWDEYYWCVFVEDVLVEKIQEHGYGFNPWIILVASGTPIRSTDNDQSEWPQYVGPSIFDSIKNAYSVINQVLSMLMDAIERDANPPILYFFDPANEHEMKEFKIHPGGVTQLFYDTERIEPIKVGPAPTDASPLLNAMAEDVDKGGLPSSLWGDATNAGYAATVAQASAENMLAGIVNAMSFGQEEVTRMSISLIRDLHDKDVGYFVKDQAGSQWISGDTISPQELGQAGPNVKVIYRQVTPRDLTGMANIAVQTTDKKIRSRAGAMEDYLGVEDPERELQIMLAEEILTDDDVRKNVLVPEALAMTDPALRQAWDSVKLMQKFAPPQPPQGPGGPPGAPPQGAPPQPPNNILPSQLNPSANLNPLLQSLGSAAGGAGLTRPPGGAGAAAPPIRLPLG